MASFPTGPTIGVQATRDNAGYREGTVVPYSVAHTTITPSMTSAQIQAAVRSGPGKFWWDPGRYELTARIFFDTANNQEHRLATGPNRNASDTAIITGASPFTGSWTQSGALWVIDDTRNFTPFHQTEGTGGHQYHSDYLPAGDELEVVVRDGIPLYPLSSQTGLAGRNDAYYHNRSTGKTYIGTNPAGHTWHKMNPWTVFLFDVSKAGIQIKGGILEFGSFGCFRLDGQTNAANTPDDFLMQDTELRYGRYNNANISGAVSGIQNATFQNVTFHHGGRYNFSGGGGNDSNAATPSFTVVSQGLLFDKCVSAYGNMYHWGQRLTGGAFGEGNDKILNWDDVRYTGCWLHDADGSGTWWDTRVTNSVLEQSVIEHNYHAGIHNEDNNDLDTTDIKIRYNYFADNVKNGPMPAPFNGSNSAFPNLPNWTSGAAVFDSTSAWTEVHNNIFYDNKGSDVWLRFDLRLVDRLKEFNFHHNEVFRWESDNFSYEYIITYRDSQPDVYQDSTHNRFDNNVYHVPPRRKNPAAPAAPSKEWFFAPSGTRKTWTQWRQGFTTIVGGSVASRFDPNSTFLEDLSEAGPGGAGVPVSERDIAQPVTVKRIYNIAQVVEKNVALPVGGGKVTGQTKFPPLVIETDIAQPLSAWKKGEWAGPAIATTLTGFTIVIPQVVERNIAQPVTLPEFLIQVAESDIAQPLNAWKLGSWSSPVSVTTLTDGSVDPFKVVDIVQVVEKNVAPPLQNAPPVLVTDGYDHDIYDTDVYDGVAVPSVAVLSSAKPFGLEHVFTVGSLMHTLPSHFTVPDRYPSLLAWWSASTISAETGTGIAQWDGASDTTIDFVQNTGASQPTFIKNAIAGRPVVRFDGVDDVMSATMPFTQAGKTIIAVARRVGSPDAAKPALWGFDVNNANLYDNGTTWGWRKTLGSASPTVITDTPEEFNILTTRIISNTEMESFGNGELQTTFDPIDVAATAISKTFTLASAAASGQPVGRFDVAEILVFNSALTDAEREGVEQYLGIKYNLFTTSSAMREDRQVLGNFEDNADIAGGYIQASGVISPEEFANHPSIYTMGATWKVRDIDSGEYLFAGELWDPVESEGVVALVSEGWGKRSDKEVMRYNLQTANLDVWAPANQEPHDYTNWERIVVEMNGDTVRYRIGKDTSFKRSSNGVPQQGWSSGIVAWTLGSDIRYVAFTIDRSKPDPDYVLELLSGNGPDGAMHLVNSWSMGAGGGTAITQAVPAGDDQVMLRLRRPQDKEIKRAPSRTFTIKNLRVGGIAQSDDFDLDDFFTDFFTRMGAVTTSIAPSNQSVLPFDSGTTTLGQIADEMTLLGQWFWRIWADPQGDRLGEAGPFGFHEWVVSNPHMPVRLIPDERWNQVAFPYNYGDEQTVTKTVTANPNPFPNGFDRTFSLQWEDPPREDIATIFAQATANELAKDRVSGSGTFSEVESPSNPGTPVSPNFVRPGDVLVLANYGSIRVNVGSLKHSPDGKLIQVEFSSGNPILDRWLANRARLLNKGRSQAQATLGLIGLDEPAVPANLLVVPYDIEQKDGDTETFLFANWSEVTDTIDGDGTAIDEYELRYRPINKQTGVPVTRPNGGGWRKHTIKQPKKADINDPTPTEVLLRDINQHKKWRWEVQVSAVDVLGQQSEWSASYIVGLNAHVLPTITNVSFEVSPVRMEAEWTIEADPDDATLSHPGVAYLQAQVATAPSFATNTIIRSDKHFRGENKVFRFKKPVENTDYYFRVRPVDVYGFTSATWYPANNGISARLRRAPAPSGLSLTFDSFERHREDIYRAIVRWDELSAWEDYIREYQVQFEVSADGTNWNANHREQARISADASQSGTSHVVFKEIHKNKFYRARVRAIDVRDRWGDWSAWTSATEVTDTTPPNAPSPVVGTANLNSVHLKWERSADVNAVPDPTVAGYQVQVSNKKDYSDGPIVFDKSVDAEHYRHETRAYKKNFWLRVRAYDAEGNFSGWQEPTGLPISPLKTRAPHQGNGLDTDIDWHNLHGKNLVDGQTNRAYLQSQTANASASVLLGSDIASANLEWESQIQLSPSVMRTSLGVLLKYLNSSNHFSIRIDQPTTTNSRIRLVSRLADVETTLASQNLSKVEGSRVRFRVTYNATSGFMTIFIDEDNDGSTMTATLSNTGSVRATFNSYTRVGLWGNRGSTTGTDNGRARVEFLRVRDTTLGIDYLDDDFDRTSLLSNLGTAASGQAWTANSGTWDIGNDQTAYSIIGMSAVVPAFFAEDPSSRTTGLGEDNVKDFGEGGANTVAMSVEIDRPTRFLAWSTASLSVDEPLQAEAWTNLRQYIGVDEDGTGYRGGRFAVTASDKDDADHSWKRSISNMRSYFVDPEEQGKEIVTVNFAWLYGYGNGTGTKNVVIANQKLIVMAIYGPDVVDSITDTRVVSPTWTRSGFTRERYLTRELDDTIISGPPF